MVWYGHNADLPFKHPRLAYVSSEIDIYPFRLK